MTWLIIALILLAAFGPVLWLVPSKKDRHLSALREQARREGLVVELRRLPKLQPSARERVTAGGRVKEPLQECAAYIQTMRRRLVMLPSWRVHRGTGELPARPGWYFDFEQRARGEAVDATMAELGSLFERLPADVIALELTDRTLVAYWLERGAATRETVTDMASAMHSAEQALLDLDSRIQSLAEDDDS
ncbi:MAG: hypothetical protein GWM88_16660 [Pseudomonadales bacterium]|nr:hypothetical protein [Pseudomonadales bacterium]NIX09564.1 hypothetical protein [Pseudomonadales bacterium]